MMIAWTAIENDPWALVGVAVCVGGVSSLYLGWLLGALFLRWWKRPIEPPWTYAASCGCELTREQYARVRGILVMVDNGASRGVMERCPHCPVCGKPVGAVRCCVAPDRPEFAIGYSIPPGMADTLSRKAPLEPGWQGLPADIADELAALKQASLDENAKALAGANAAIERLRIVPDVRLLQPDTQHPALDDWGYATFTVERYGD